MAARLHAIADETAAVLAEGSSEGMVYRLPDRRLPPAEYRAVNKVLEGLGGKWDRRAKGHVFPFDPAELLAEALERGTFQNRQQVLGAFETPAALAREMAAFAVVPGGAILEPSAGGGMLVEAALRKGAHLVQAVEVDTYRATDLRSRFGPEVDVYMGRFEDFAATQAVPFDGIVMNPPFASGLDAEHVMLAWALLDIGGSLAAIVSEGLFQRSDKKAAGFREFLADEMRDPVVRRIPPGTFREAGTEIATRLILASRAA